MDKAKPIEPGCLAIAQSRQVPWKIVRVIKYVGTIPSSKTKKLWKVDQEMSWSDDLGRSYTRPYWPERSLLRIDDPDIQRQIEAEHKKAPSKETGLVPATVKSMLGRYTQPTLLQAMGGV